MAININDMGPADKGRRVAYQRRTLKEETPIPRREFGEITSWNDQFIFVRFRGPTGEACDPSDLTFEER